MSTPESKLAADIIKTFWTDYRLYIACTLCLIVGGIIGHKL